MFKSTMKWLVANKVETMTGHILTPYPGTVLHDRLEAEGRIIDHDYSHYNTANVVYKPLLPHARGAPRRLPVDVQGVLLLQEHLPEDAGEQAADGALPALQPRLPKVRRG